MDISTIDHERQENVSIFRIKGKLNVQTAPQIEKGFAIEGVSPDIVVNMQGVDYISSAGLRIFLTLSRSQEKLGQKLVLCSLTEMVRNIFCIAGLDQYFVLKGTEKEALRFMEMEGNERTS